MRFAVGTFPGNPSSTPGSCRFCGIGRLRDGETGVVVTENWIDMEGVIILCEACAGELGRLVPNPEVARLEALLTDARFELMQSNTDLQSALDIIKSQRAEMMLTLPAPAPVKVAAKRA